MTMPPKPGRSSEKTRTVYTPDPVSKPPAKKGKPAPKPPAKKGKMKQLQTSPDMGR